MRNELLDKVRSYEPSQFGRIFEGDGQRAGGGRLQTHPRYNEWLTEAVELIAGVRSGRTHYERFQEAMTTADFPLLFGDVLERELLAGYETYDIDWNSYLRRSRVRDFRPVKRFSTDGATGRLDKVGQQEEYPERDLDESDFSFSVEKYGAGMPFSWETFVNDDLDAFMRLPMDLANAARETEEHFAATLIGGENGPNGNHYTSGNGNIITGNPALSRDALQSALTQLSQVKDANGVPIRIRAAVLVVVPALVLTADEILNTREYRIDDGGNTRIISGNGVSVPLTPVTNHYLPDVASTANDDTSWWLFASPTRGRPGGEIGFLRGNEQPSVWIKKPNAQRVGGGEVSPFEGDFDTDTIQYRVRHVLGGTMLDPKVSMASNGSGA